MEIGAAFRAIGSAVAQWFTHFSVALVGSLQAVALSFPLLLLAALVASLTRSWGLLPVILVPAVGVLPNPATAGVHYASSLLAQGEDVAIRDIWAGLRRYAGPAARCWLVSAPITAIIVLNALFYGLQRGALQSILGLLWTLVLAVWVGVLLYVYPLLFVQERQSVMLTFRNAIVLAASRPIATFVVLPVWLGILIVGAATGLISISGLALAASVQHNALRKLVAYRA